MCDFEKLYCDENGYIIRCTKCNAYRITFHTTAITLSEKNFAFFCEILDEIILDYEAINEELPSKCLYVPSPVDGFGLILTIDEAKCLQNIVQKADIELKTRALLSLFNK